MSQVRPAGGLPTELPALTSLRAAAALGVFAYHAGRALPGSASVLGFTGVGFFFVLSGFVLTWGGAAERSSPKQYLARRFARVYPSHLFIWLILLVVPLEAMRPTFWQVVSNGALLQAWGGSLAVAYSMNGVSWSLSCEIAFYLALPLLLPRLRRVRLRHGWMIAGTAFAAASVFVCAATALRLPDPWHTFATVNPLVRAPEFVLGVMGALTLRAGVRIPLWTLAPALMFAVVGVVLLHETPAITVWAIPVFLLVIVMTTQRQIRSGRPLFDQPWLVHAGKVSFAFYLVHQLVLLRMYAVMGPGIAAAVAALLLSAVLALALHDLVEMPVHRWIVRRTRSTKPVPPSAP